MRSIVGITLLILTAASSGFSICSEADRNSLIAWDKAWGDANVRGDRAAMMKVYADDYVGMPDMLNKTRTIDNVMATYERNRSRSVEMPKTTPDHYVITCTPNSATITHRNTTWEPAGPNGATRAYYARSVHVVEKRNGSWQAVANVPNDLDDYGTIWYLEQDWNDAIMNRDKAWFEGNFAPDFQSVSSTTAVRMNKAQEIADTVDSKSTTDSAETTDMNIRIDRDYAIVTGTFRMIGKDEKGAAYDRSIRYNDTWIRRDGRWYAWSTAGTVIP